jgi:hypothetical protein
LELSERQLVVLEGLVNELLKAAPEEEKIQSFMTAAGLEDPIDPVARIQTVLDALRFELPDSEIKE